MGPACIDSRTCELWQWNYGSLGSPDRHRLRHLHVDPCPPHLPMAGKDHRQSRDWSADRCYDDSYDYCGLRIRLLY